MPESQSCHKDMRNLSSLGKRCTILALRGRFLLGSSPVWEEHVISPAGSVTVRLLSVVGVMLIRNLFASCFEREAQCPVHPESAVCLFEACFISEEKQRYEE